MFYEPFHTDEQRCKERICDSAERPATFRCRRSLRAAQGIRLWLTSERLPFGFVLGKQKERKKNYKQHRTLYMNLTLYITSQPA
jgi:hypothetical protein